MRIIFEPNILSGHLAFKTEIPTLYSLLSCLAYHISFLSFSLKEKPF